MWKSTSASGCDDAGVLFVRVESDVHAARCRGEQVRHITCIKTK